MLYAPVNGLRLYYELHGPEEAFPVVCINGLTMDTAAWGFQLPALTPHFRVVLYDCRGQGKSDKPEGPYLPDQHARDLVGLLDALGLERAHLLGLSNGGVIAMSVAARHPDRVAGLVLVDTFAHSDVLMQAKLDSWVAALEAGGPEARFDVALPWIWSRAFLAQHADEVRALRERAAQAPTHAVRALIEGARQIDVRSLLPSIQAPTLVLVGEEDVLTPIWYAREIVEAIPHASLVVIGGAGHAPTIERPDIVNALAVVFFKQHTDNGNQQA